jgi:hypothetical protein
MKFFAHKTMASIMLLAGIQTSHAASVINGSFELGNFTPLNQDTMSLSPGATDLTGWEVHTDITAWIGPNNPWSLTANDGDFFLDLTDYSSGSPFGGVSQQIDTTIGQMYEVSFDLGSSNIWGRPSAIEVSAGNNSLVFMSTLTGGDSDWEQFSMLFTAEDLSTTISFSGHTGHVYIGLDNVSVSAVPLPAGIWLFGSAIAFLFGSQIRKA